MNETFQNRNQFLPPEDEMETEGMEYTPDNEEPLQQHYEPVPYQERLIHPGIPQPAKPSPRKEPDFLGQMTDKIRQQALLLQEQETYKMLCEKRILELCPTHPLPVTEAHLGSTLSAPRGASSVPISELKRQLIQKEQKIEQLTQELQQTHKSPLKDSKTNEPAGTRAAQLQKEKTILEQTLRAEILANEEQRNYIQILKEALETKIEDMGFSEILNQARYGRQAPHAGDIFTEIATRKKAADQSRKVAAKNEGLALELQSHLALAEQKLEALEKENHELSENCAVLSEDLNNGLQALEQARESMQKLEEEKNTLLDYIEEQNEKNEKMNANMESLNTLHNKLYEEKLNSDKRIEELEAGIRQYEEEVEKLKEHSSGNPEIANQIETLKSRLANVKSICEEKAKKISQIIGELNAEKELNETRDRELMDALNALQDLKNESQTLAFKREQFDNTLAGDKKIYEERISTLTQEKEIQLNTIKQLQRQIELLQSKNKSLQSNYEALNATVNEMQQEAEAVNSRQANVKELEALNKSLLKKIANLENRASVPTPPKSPPQSSPVVDSSRQCSNCEKLKLELNSLQEELFHVKDETAQLRGDLERKEYRTEELKSYSPDSDPYKREIEKLQRSELNLKSDYERTLRSHQEDEQVINDLQTQLIASKSHAQEKDAQLSILKKQLNDRQKEVNFGLKEISEIRKTLTQKDHDISELSIQLNEAESRLRQEQLQSEDLREQLNQLGLQFDTLNSQHQVTIAQMELIKQKTEEESDQQKLKLYHLDTLRSGLNNCISLIRNMGKRLETSPILKSVISRRFRDVLATYGTLQSVDEMSALDELGKRIEEIIKYLLEEVENLSKSVNTQKSNELALQQKFINLEAKIDTMSADAEALKEREKYLKMEADTLREGKKQIEMEKSIWHSKETQLENELRNSKSECMKLKRETEKLELQARQATNNQERAALEFKHKTLSAERENIQIRNAEDKVSFLTNEKKDLERLLTKISASMPSIEFQKIVSSLISTQAEIHLNEREKYRLSAALTQAEGMLRNHASSSATFRDQSLLRGSPGKSATIAEQGVRLRKEVEVLRDSLQGLEEKLEVDRRKLASLEEELKTIELCEKRKTNIFGDNEKYLAQKQAMINELNKENEILKIGKREAEAAYNGLLEERLYSEAPPLSRPQEQYGSSFRYPIPEIDPSEIRKMDQRVDFLKSRIDEARDELSGRSTLQQRLRNVKSTFTAAQPLLKQA